MTNKERYIGKKQITAFVDGDLLTKLKQISKNKGMFFSRFIEKILEQYVKEYYK